LIPWVAAIINRQIKELNKQSKILARGYGKAITEDGVPLSNPAALVEDYLDYMKGGRDDLFERHGLVGGPFPEFGLGMLHRGFSDLSDWLTSERPQLPRTIGEALVRSRRWHAEMERRLKKSEVKLVKDAGTVVHRWRDGWTLRKLGPLPDLAGLEQERATTAMELVGDMLGHCYGSDGMPRYAREIRDGEASMFTLFNSQGVPKVSIHLILSPEWNVEQLRGAQNDLPDPKYYPRLRSALAFIFGYKPKDSWQFIEQLGEAAVVLDPKYIQPRDFLGKGERHFENLFQPISEMEGLVEKWPKLQAMDKVMRWCEVNKDQNWLQRSANLGGASRFVLQAELIWLGTGGRTPTSHPPPVVPTRKLVAQVAWDISEWEESNWDNELHYSEIMRIKPPKGIDEGEWEERIENLHYRAQEGAMSQAWKDSFGRLKAADQHTELREWAHWVSRGANKKSREETTSAFVVSRTLVTNFTNKFIDQVNAHGEEEEPFEKLVESVVDASNSYLENLRYEYYSRFIDLMEELQTKVGGDVITRLGSFNRVARRRSARHHRGASITRSPSRPRMGRRRSKRRVPRWPL